MNYKKFEDLPCWKVARKLSQEIFKIITKGKLNNDYSLKDQLWRAVGSVMDNIAEGFDDGNRKEFIKFLGYAQRSCGEVQSQLYRALDCGYINESEFNVAYDLASECRKQIKGFRKYLRNYKNS
ncbi:MAG: four helix bundle protein [Candidatus Njordarchaeales archaeon]